MARTQKTLYGWSAPQLRKRLRAVTTMGERQVQQVTVLVNGVTRFYRVIENTPGDHLTIKSGLLVTTLEG